MTEIKKFVWGVLGAVVRVLLWLLMAVLALFLLLVAVVLLLVGVLWALLRGQRPAAPVFVGRFRRFTTERVWPGGNRQAGASHHDRAEVVDVEVREVDGSQGAAPPTARPDSPPGLEDRRS